mgnify:CR=1 FL=1
MVQSCRQIQPVLCVHLFIATGVRCPLALVRDAEEEEQAQDVLGERLVRSLKRRVRPETFSAEASALGEGDLVVHADHGIGRFDGLTNIQVAGAAHDCLRFSFRLERARVFSFWVE